MKRVFVSLVTLCLFMSASFAWAQGGDVSKNDMIGLNAFSLGISQADAKKLGATPVKENTLKAKVTWGDQDWNAVLNFKNDSLVVLGLTSKDSGYTVVKRVLQSLDSHQFVPFLMNRKVGDNPKQTRLFELFEEGKGEAVLNDAMYGALNEYAEQGTGSIAFMFCPSDVIAKLAGFAKAEGDNVEQSAMAVLSDTIVYSLKLEKLNDSITVVVSTFGALTSM